MKSVPNSRYICFFALAGTALACDLYTKWWAFHALGYEHRSSGWLMTWLWGEGVFEISTTFNHGALWGIGQGYSWLFAALSIAAAAGVLYWLFMRGEARSWWLTISLALIMAGTLGNLYDRLGLHGLVNENGALEYAVRDFVHFRIFLHFTTIDWAVFNFADMYLVTGAIMLLIQSFRHQPESNPASQVAEGRHEQAIAHLKPVQVMKG